MNLVLCMIGLDIKVYNYAWEDDKNITTRFPIAKGSH